MNWVPDALLQRASQAPAFLRQTWDASPAQDFGPWNLKPKADPLSGQTEDLPLLTEEAPADSEIASDAEDPPLPSESYVGLEIDQAQLDNMLSQAREEGRREGHAAAIEQMRDQAEAEKQTLHAISESLHTLHHDTARWLEPLKKLSIHVAQELVRAELRLDSTAVERLIQGCIDALNPTQEPIVVEISPIDMSRLQSEHFPGITFEVNDTLSEGSVRARISDSSVQDLMEHRLSALSQQILGATL
jgi:flagellar biosynthesis/type III secretory pathway protein FliH